MFLLRNKKIRKTNLRELCWNYPQNSIISGALLNVFLGVDVKDFGAVTSWCKDSSIDLVVVGPEDPLAAGLADHLNDNGKLLSEGKGGASMIP